MKLDEKIFTYFESCNSPVDKEGYLYKKGEIKTSYQKRWFVLKGNLLFYKDRAADRDLVGVIVLEGCTVQLCESDEQFAFSLVWNEPGLRTYKFAAEDQESQESWIKALLSANHSYLTLLVMDLEKKYRDALAEFPSKPANSFTMPNFPLPEYSPTYDTRQIATLPSYRPGAGAAAAAPFSLSYGPTLRSDASKRSPAARPKRTADGRPLSASAAAMGDWSSFSLDTNEEFSKLHEEFGKEIKELVLNWSKERREEGDDVAEKDLIDFG